MSAVIPDPFEPEKRGIRTDGVPVFGVTLRWRSLDEEGKPTGEWQETLAWHDGTLIGRPE